MVSSKLVKLSSPVARSCLVAVSLALLIDATLTIFAAVQYPYLVDYYNDDLYITSSRTIAVVYSTLGVAAIIIATSTAVACYKNATNYVLIHAGITGVFVPVSILVYFTTSSARYKAADYIGDYHQMIADYRISVAQRRVHDTNQSGNKNNGHESSIESTFRPKIMLSSFINLIDSLQTKHSCCGVDSAQDWIKKWKDYVAPSCCKEYSTKINSQWSDMFRVDHDHEFKYCTESNSYQLGCLVALKEDEHSKYAWLSDLLVFMIVITLANTIVSLLLFGLSKTEDSSYDSTEQELSMVGASAKPGGNLPTITSIKHRPSVVTTLSSAENISVRAQAVRFNLGNSPRTSISGPSKFSAGARRGSSFI